MACKDTQVEYYGNGIQTDFLFPHEYENEEDIRVYLWNQEQFEYLEQFYRVDFSFVNASTIRFTVPPPEPAPALPGEELIPNIRIIRITNVDDPVVIFAPGNSIRAADLNANFDQLRFAVQESRCLAFNADENIELAWQKGPTDTLYYGFAWDESDTKISTNKKLGEQFWNKSTETVTSLKNWEGGNDDLHIPTVKAVSLYVDGEIKELEDYIDNEISDLRDEFFNNAIDTFDQNNNRWISDDKRFATTGAIAARHDTFLTESGPKPNNYFTPGKFWVNSDTHKLSYWTPQGYWVNVVAQDPPPPFYVQSTRPTNNRLGDAWFDTSRKTSFVYTPGLSDNVLLQENNGKILSDTAGRPIGFDEPGVWSDIRPVDGSDVNVDVGVSKIIAGRNITISPTNGTGTVTINSSGDSSVTTPSDYIRFDEAADLLVEYESILQAPTSNNPWVDSVSWTYPDKKPDKVYWLRPKGSSEPYVEAPFLVLPLGSRLRIYQSDADRAANPLAFYGTPEQEWGYLDEEASNGGGELQTFNDEPGNNWTQIRMNLEVQSYWYMGMNDLIPRPTISYRGHGVFCPGGKPADRSSIIQQRPDRVLPTYIRYDEGNSMLVEYESILQPPTDNNMWAESPPWLSQNGLRKPDRVYWLRPKGTSLAYVEAPYFVLPHGSRIRIYQSDADRAEHKIIFSDSPGGLEFYYGETDDYGGELQTFNDEPGNCWTQVRMSINHEKYWYKSAADVYGDTFPPTNANYRGNGVLNLGGHPIDGNFRSMITTLEERVAALEADHAAAMSNMSSDENGGSY